jgi:hypothetical protein
MDGDIAILVLVFNDSPDEFEIKIYLHKFE